MVKVTSFALSMNKFNCSSEKKGCAKSGCSQDGAGMHQSLVFLWKIYCLGANVQKIFNFSRRV
ncbi:MAG: hypothetical protein CK425_07005 [Parachlamydia sp.]|nr:MAG: hypothetical protein CK425_07005 [Parachlamydia sp.]